MHGRFLFWWMPSQRNELHSRIKDKMPASGNNHSIPDSSAEESQIANQLGSDSRMVENPSSDIQRIFTSGKEIILVGTAHISRDSVDTVKQVIEMEVPDTVCVELDQQRYQALMEPDRWKSLDLVQVIRKGQGAYLLTNLALSAFQKKMGLQTGVKPGEELLAAAQTAEGLGIDVRLIDREIRTTLLRAWRKTGLWKKMNLLAALLAGFFETQQIDPVAPDRYPLGHAGGDGRPAAAGKNHSGG
jgi:hypothetical protein